jgi:tetratricopeptide (TPR) repeat protein
MRQVLRPRLWLSAILALVLATAWAQQERSAEARAAVAQAVYAASATAAAEQRLADASISQQRHEIETLRIKLATTAAQEASARTRLQSQLAEAQEHFVQQLAERDRAYAQEIAVFRREVQDIASTPEGEAALRQYNAGDEVGALVVLDRLVEARERARQVRANIETAAERRRVATLALDAKNKGKVRADAVISRYEEVTRLDAGVQSDWVELARLYGEVGRLQDARQAALKAADTAEDQRDRPVALNELGDVLVAQGDLVGAKQRYQESLEIDKRLSEADRSSASLQRDVSVSLEKLGNVLVAQGDLAGATLRYQESLGIAKRMSAADPSSASLQRDVWVSLWKLAGIKDSGVTWRQVAEALGAMQGRGVLNPADRRALDKAREKAAVEAARR